MCVVLDPDIIVASLATSKVSFLKAKSNSSKSITITIDECKQAQMRSRTAALGNVVANSSDAQFESFLSRNKDVFQKISDKEYAISNEFCNAESVKKKFEPLISESYPKFVRKGFGFN